MSHDIKITRAEIESLYNPLEVEGKVRDAIEYACSSPGMLVRFLSRYANLNAWFGSGVASLAGKIGRSRGVFMDPREPIHDIADRSVLVASYFFDAARDEFDDRDTQIRDTHRCLAQACIKGTLLYYFNPNLGDSHATVNDLLAQPLWLSSIGARVAQGYGITTSEVSGELFRSMGYHLGSEILADQEFTLIDQILRRTRPDLVSFLSANDFQIHDQKHRGYSWIGLHSGAGSAKEVEHYEAATAGVEAALNFAVPDAREFYRHQVHLGIGSFVRDHQEFFGAVST